LAVSTLKVLECVIGKAPIIHDYNTALCLTEKVTHLAALARDASGTPGPRAHCPVEKKRD